MCTKNKLVQGYGIDLGEEPIHEGRDILIQYGLQDRITLDVLDITKIDQAPENMRDIEAATVFFVLHEVLYQGEHKVVETLKSFKRIFPNALLIVFEVIRPTLEELCRRPGMAVQYLLQHDITRQKVVSSAKWRELFRASGFSFIDERYLAFARTSMFMLQ